MDCVCSHRTLPHIRDTVLPCHLPTTRHVIRATQMESDPQSPPALESSRLSLRIENDKYKLDTVHSNGMHNYILKYN